MEDMRRFIFFSFLLASAAVAVACSTETIVKNAAPAADGGPGVVTDEDAGPPGEAPDAAPVDRSVKGTWEKLTVNPPDGTPIVELASVIVRSPTDVYVAEGASNLGTGFYHYDGKGWTGVRYSGFATRLVGVGTDVLSYGSDLFIKAKSDEWERIPQPATSGGSPASIWSLWGTRADDFYASTAAGNMRVDSDGWSDVAALGTAEGTFTGSGAKDVWFASAKGKLLSHYDGTKWQNQFESLPEEIKAYPVEGPYSMFTSGPGDVWAMGRARTLLHYDGAAWTVVPGPDDEWGCDLARGWASSKKNAWLVGSKGCVFHWDGKAWEKIPSGVTENIYGIHGTDAEHVWIAPYSKTTVLRLKPE